MVEHDLRTFSWQVGAKYIIEISHKNKVFNVICETKCIKTQK